jgi:hypothetical protein
MLVDNNEADGHPDAMRASPDQIEQLVPAMLPIPEKGVGENAGKRGQSDFGHWTIKSTKSEITLTPFFSIPTACQRLIPLSQVPATPGSASDLRALEEGLRPWSPKGCGRRL